MRGSNNPGFQWSVCFGERWSSRLVFPTDISLFAKNQGKPLSKFNEVRFFGTLLLYVCIKSFQIPPSWKIPRLSDLYENTVLFHLSQNPLSTWTSAIIFACLSSRSKETNWQLVLNIKHSEYSDDTNFEQLTLNTLDDLELELDQARSILEKYQLSTFNLEPRQLIPIHIMSLQKNDFNILKSSF